MVKRSTLIILLILGVLFGAGLGVLIWWLVTNDNVGPYETIRLEGKGLGEVASTAAFTRIQGGGDVFWWFYPTLAEAPTTRPVLLWLHGVTGLAPSFMANFGMFGPYDVNLNRRNDSWVNDYNLLFVDSPVGTGFSTTTFEKASGDLDLERNVEYLQRALQSFYDLHEGYKDSPVYICSQGDGSQLAVELAIKLVEGEIVSSNVKGVILGNPVISPALALTKLGFYLEELGYIDGSGRAVIQNYTDTVNLLLQKESLGEAFDQFISLDQVVNNDAGAIAVNLGYIVEKLTKPSEPDYFGQKSYIRNKFETDLNVNNFMDTVVAPALGMPNDVKYDSQRDSVIQIFRNSYMTPIVNKVEHILRNTNLTVNIYNGNMDAVSNTPGQLEWINNLVWDGQDSFLNAQRNTLVVNRLIEGYFQETERLRFYWINVAGVAVPLDNPVGIRRVLIRMTT